MSISNESALLTKIGEVIRNLDRHGDSCIHSRNPDAPGFRYVSIPEGEAEALRNCVIREKAVNSIEIGLAYGFSALHICEALVRNTGKKAKHTIIDPWQIQDDGYAGCGLENLSAAGLGEIIKFHSNTSQIILPELLNQKKHYDFAFVDGNHLFDYVFTDLFYLCRILKPASVIFLDDYNFSGIKKAAAFFIENLDWKIEGTGSDRDHEWAVLRTSANEDKRDYQYFREF